MRALEWVLPLAAASSNFNVGINAFQLNSPNKLFLKPKSTKLFLDGEGMAGGTFNKHLLGDVLRALQPRYLSQVKDSIEGKINGPKALNLDPLLRFVEEEEDNKPSSGGLPWSNSNNRSLSPPSWEELEKRLESQQKGSEKVFRSQLKEGTIHSALTQRRSFSASPTTSITLYRDTASWCPYCQKVWIALEEKQLSYQIVRVAMNCYAGGSKPEEFLKVQPSGTLPCLVIEKSGEEKIILRESDEMLEVLDTLEVDESSTRRKTNVPQLLPNKGTEEADDRMKYLCDDGRNSLERRLYGEWMWYLTGKRKPVEYRERYEAVLDEVDDVLKGSTIKFVPFLERQAASLLYFKGFNVRDETRWPNIVKWFEAMESRSSYLETKSDIYTHSRALPPQLGAGCTFAPEEECGTMRDTIDALNVLSSLDSSTILEEWSEPGWDPKIEGSRREAAERILHNRKNIVKFASRGAGTPGFPAASAALADPRATLNDDANASIDIFLRYVIDLLLLSDKNPKSPAITHTLASIEAAARELGKGGRETVESTVDCLDYLRLRIGVPRDMSYPAAHVLRKEMLNVSKILLDADSMSETSTEFVDESKTQVA